MSYKPGDIVILKSGGPYMTVEAIPGDGKLRCVWFVMTSIGWSSPARSEFVPDSVVPVHVDRRTTWQAIRDFLSFRG